MNSLEQAAKDLAKALPASGDYYKANDYTVETIEKHLTAILKEHLGTCAIEGVYEMNIEQAAKALLKELHDNVLDHEYAPDNYEELCLAIIAKHMEAFAKSEDIYQDLVDALREKAQLKEQLALSQARLSKITQLVWDTRWVSADDAYQNMVGIAAEVNSGNFESIDKLPL
jgi:ATP-dependent exoDNAse (exonuclease V) beta subunit